MRIIVSILIFLSFIYPSFADNLKKNPSNTKDIKEIQQSLKAFILKYNKDLPLDQYKESLEKIYKIYKKIKNRNETFSFYFSLLTSIRYKKLYPYAFFYLSGFYRGKTEEKYLIKSLKFSLTMEDRTFATENLYKYYKKHKIRYLELSYLLKLIELQKTNKNYADLEALFSDLGAFYKTKRDYLSALNHYFNALMYSRLLKVNRCGYIFLNISEIFSVLNRKQLAKKYIKKALDYTIKNKNDSLKVLVLNFYSNLNYDVRDYNRALKFINLSIKTEKNLNQYVNIIVSYYRKSLILFRIGRAKEAMELLKSAVEMGLESGRFESLLPIIIEYIERLIESGEFSEASFYLSKMDDIYAPYYPYYFFYYYLKANFFEKKGDLYRALIFYNRSIKKLDDYFSGLSDQRYYLFKNKINNVYDKVITFYIRMYSETGRKNYIKKALYFSEIKNSYISDLITFKTESYSHLQDEKKKVEQELLKHNKKFLQLLHNNPDEFEIHFYENKLNLLKKEYTELMELIVEIPLKFEKYNFNELNIRMIQRRLDPNQLIIKYCLLNENSYVFYLDKNSIGCTRLKNSTSEIMEQIKRLTEPLDDFTKGKVDYLRINYNLELAHHLFRILLSDVLKIYKDKKEIFIVPDKELFKLPFEALVTGFNKGRLDADVVFSEYSLANYMVQKYLVSYYLSLFHFQKKETSPGKKQYHIVAFGNPLVNRIAEEKVHPYGIDLQFINRIPSSQKELHIIKKIFGEKRSKIFLMEQFNRENFENIAPKSRILHIATHFINSVDYPQYSALLFSPGKNGNSLYFAHEILDLNLDAELVVLSACESSEKNLLGLQGMRGMTASFRKSGVRSMIVSMWPVDEKSSKLVSLFYRAYRKYKDISFALRKAKLKIMKRTEIFRGKLKISFSHPFLWSTYILYNFY